jgi:hypothetical protein
MSGGLPGLVRDLSSLNRLFTQTSMSMFCWFGTGKTRMPPERSHVSFRQLRTFRRTRSGQLSAIGLNRSRGRLLRHARRLSR